MIAPNQVKIYEFPDIPDYSEASDVVLIFPSSKSVRISSLFKGVTTFDFKENYGLEKGFNMGTLLKTNLENIMSDEDKEKLASDAQAVDYSLHNLPFKKAVFIDSTWKQCRSIYRDPRINAIKTCIIQNRITKFWRVQKGAPNWYLSTIEAIHQFLLELHVSAWGISQKYYDNCLDDLQLDASFIPTAKIIAEGEACSNEFSDKSHEYSDLCKPYTGQYDNLLFFFSFLYSLIRSMDDVNGKLNVHPSDE